MQFRSEVNYSLNVTFNGLIYLPGLESHKQTIVVMSWSASQFRMEINRVSVGQKKEISMRAECINVTY
jgi:hypothetical protein